MKGVGRLWVSIEEAGRLVLHCTVSRQSVYVLCINIGDRFSLPSWIDEMNTGKELRYQIPKAKECSLLKSELRKISDIFIPPCLDRTNPLMRECYQENISGL